MRDHEGMGKLDRDEQDQIVDRLMVEIETMDSDEWEALRGQLDDEHQAQVDEEAREWANDAVGDEHWDSDK